MISAPTHRKELDRLEALRRYQILDTPPEKAFDDLTTLASVLCHTPIALVTFVDRDRQWFKSRMGISVAQTSRQFSFCAHTILQSSVLVVPDASADDRFKDNPWVVNDPSVRFYAGAPVFTVDGLPVGTVCVFDREPRTLSVGEEESLRTVARLGTTLLEFRRTTKDLNAAVERIEIMSELLPMCTSCRRLQNEQGQWLVLEQYVRGHGHPAEGHSVCPDCAKKLYPDYIRS